MRYVVAVGVLVGLAFAGYGTFLHIEADRAVVEAAQWVERQPERVADVCGDDDPRAMDPPMQGGLQYKITCPSVDAGTAIADLSAPDGGTLSIETLYVAPVVGAAANVRVGMGSVASVTASTGLEVGPTGRDGQGVSMDVRGTAKPQCKSEGVAQQVDVLTGVH